MVEASSASSGENSTRVVGTAVGTGVGAYVGLRVGMGVGYGVGSDDTVGCGVGAGHTDSISNAEQLTDVLHAVAPQHEVCSAGHGAHKARSLISARYVEEAQP